MTLSSLSNFITTRLGRMKAWAACDSLDWVTCLPLHFTLAYIVYRESRTHKVVYIHLHYGINDEMYIGIDSRFGYQTRSTNILSPEQAAVHRVFPCDSTRGLRIAQMSEQFSWLRHWADCPLKATTESKTITNNISPGILSAHGKYLEIPLGKYPGFLSMYRYAKVGYFR